MLHFDGEMTQEGYKDICGLVEANDGTCACPPADCKVEVCARAPWTSSDGDKLPQSPGTASGPCGERALGSLLHWQGGNSFAATKHAIRSVLGRKGETGVPRFPILRGER